MWVQYKDIRNKIKTGDVFFTASPALFSRLIRWFTKSKVSHCGFFVAVGERMFVVESIEGSGVIMSLASSRFENVPIIVARPNKLPKGFEDSVLGAVQVTGYDLFGAIVSPFFDTKSSRAFCSEFVAKNIKINTSHFTNGVTPKDVLTALSSNIL